MTGRGQGATPDTVVVVPSPVIPPPKSAESLYFDVARTRLTSQLAQIDSIDAKASTMFTIGSTVLPITASLLTADRDVIVDNFASKYALIAGAGFYIVLVVAFVLAYRLAKWDLRPALDQWKEITVDQEEERLQRWLGDGYVEAYLSNVPQLATKAKLVGVVLWSLALEAVCLTLAVLAPLF
jgi:hypothetical protein